MRVSSLSRLPALSLAILLGACGAPTGPTASSVPTETAALSTSTASVAPTAPASAAASIAPSVPVPTSTVAPSAPGGSEGDYPELAWVNRFVMKVAVSDLNVRTKPSRSAPSNGKAPKGGLFMMYDWPVTADGYTWYPGFTLLTAKPGVLPALPTPIETGYDEVLGGWMATGTEDTPFLLPIPPRCPTTRDLANVAAMLDSERLSCFGSDTLELEGSFGCGEGCGGAEAGTHEPPWLASMLEFDYLRVPATDGSALALHFPPGGPAPPPQESRVRVRGHFSDDRSTTCRITELDAAGELTVHIDNAAAEQWCRGKFVVESYEVIG